MAAPTAYYCNPAIAGNSGTGTIGDPFGDLQYALNTITRDATNGDQINIKAGTAEILAASLTLATYGTPSANVPLILRGYTSAAGDGGMGEIDCNGVTFWTTTYTGFILADLTIHNFGNNNGIAGATNSNWIMYHCNVHKGASSPSGKSLVNINNGVVLYSYIHDAGTTGTGITSDANGKAAYNYIYNCTNIGISASTIINNVLVDCGGAASSGALRASASASLIMGNTVYSSAASTGTGASWATNIYMPVIINNIFQGYSGANGEAIYGATADVAIIGYNAYYNNTAERNITSDIYINLLDVATLAASPFTNAAGGDFSLLTSVAGAIDGAFPGAWYGPASTTDHADIGAVQNGAGAAGGGFPILRGSVVS